MLLFSLNIIFASFSTFISNYNKNATNITEYQKITQRDIDYYGFHLINSVFSDLLNNYGYQNNVFADSAIYFKSARAIDLLIELCIFNNCSTGGILFDCSLRGSCILKKVCAFKCSTDSLVSTNGQFTYQACASSKKNHLIMVSINFCPGEYIGTKYSPAYLIYGQQLLTHSNISNNRVYQISAITIYLPHSFNSTMSTIVDNIPTHSICLYVYQGNCMKNFFFLNIIRNSSPSGRGVITYLNFNDINKNIQIYSSIFLDNQNTLVFTDDYYHFLWIFGGYIKHAAHYSLTNPNENGYLGAPYNNYYQKIYFSGVISSNNPTNTYMNDHFRTYLCNPSDIPSGQDITPCQTIPPPLPSPSLCVVLHSDSLSLINMKTFFTIISSSFIYIINII